MTNNTGGIAHLIQICESKLKTTISPVTKTVSNKDGKIVMNNETKEYKHNRITIIL